MARAFHWEVHPSLRDRSPAHPIGRSARSDLPRVLEQQQQLLLAQW
jgi:hypothetical protein